ncbi:hypothetical protein FLONG3_6857 [Fusarium longipes]|uniref:Uncharacterized protein n=1 Tax=Fusarium longipes TaxID=694270 RepID=A0A395SI53_9HYPO|nr:hypothetical protein FLONG3_6857 [Fusarium longipes]
MPVSDTQHVFNLITEQHSLEHSISVMQRDARRRRRYYEADVKELRTIIEGKYAEIQSLKQQICALKDLTFPMILVEIELISVETQKDTISSEVSLGRTTQYEQRVVYFTAGREIKTWKVEWKNDGHGR